MKFNLTRPEAGALLRDKLVLATTGSVLAVLLVLGWLLFGDILSGDKKRTTFTHMHCPVCKEEHAFNAKLAGKPCTNCETGGTLTPTVGSIADGVPVSTGAKVIVYLLLAAFLVECVAYVSVRRLRALRAAEEEIRNRMVVCSCPFCQRKVGYRAPKAGTGFVCSRCKTAFRLPAPEGEPVQIV